MSHSVSPITEEYAKLTKHPVGSVREILHIALPLIIVAFSEMFIIFIDRVLLANYDITEMNAAVAAGTVFAVFLLGGIGITSMAEVFVGQHNGSKQYKQIGQPVWQMIWFSVMTALIFVPLGLWGGDLLLPDRFAEVGPAYFVILMCFGPFFVMVPALAAFYIGRGEGRFVTLTSVIANVINLLLDIVLIFGVEGVVPAMGAKGAGIASAVAIVCQCLLLGAAFLNQGNRKRFGTAIYKLKPKLLLKGLQIGFPNSIGHMMEVSAWAYVINLLARISDEHVTVVTIGQSIFYLMMFLTIGLQKGVTTVSANFIGAKNWEPVDHCYVSAIKLHGLFVLLWAIPILFFPELLVKLFLSSNMTDLTVHHILPVLKTTLFWVLVYFLFDGIFWVSVGVLMAGGDTLFPMLINGVNVWLFAIAPIYFFVVKLHGSPSLTFALSVGYVFVNALCAYFRYRSGRWKQMVVEIEH